jgi:hypothetical protein
MSKEEKSELTKLRRFYRKIAKLTLNHGAINDRACVTADKLGKALQIVNPVWWDEFSKPA